MNWSAGFLGGSALLLAFSCGNSEPGGSTRSAGAGGTSGAGTSGAGAPGAGSGNAGRSGAAGQAVGGSGGVGAAPSAGAGASAATAGSGAAGGTLTGGEGGVATGGEAGTAGSGGLSPATLLVMFDHAWLMNLCGDTYKEPSTVAEVTCESVSRWQLATSAFEAFVADPATAGLNLALRFFPDDKPAVGCNGYSSAPASDGGLDPDAGLGPDGGLTARCDTDACAQPLVEPALLSAAPAASDAQEAALVAAIESSPPAPGGTMPNPNPMAPTSAALGGAEQWATAHALAHPGEPTIVLLITSGDANGCDTYFKNIAQLAADASTAAGVLTYVAGFMGQNEQDLNSVAQAGGTEGAIFLADAGSLVEELLPALATVRGRKR